MEQMRIDRLIETAIQREDEAFHFYRELSGRVEDQSARETVEWMAEEEKKHKTFLENYRDGQYGVQDLRVSQVVYYKIAEYQEEPEADDNLRSEEVYLIAAHRELRSHHFYTELAQLHPDGDVKEMLFKLANEELRHKEKMEYLYANTAFPQTDGG